MRIKTTTWILTLVLAGLGLAAMIDPKTQGAGKSLVLHTREQDPRGELRVELNDNGFSPAQLHHAPGRIAIAVENKTLSGEYTLKLTAEDGTLLHEVHVQRGSTAWTVNLQTGRYTLTEANHPQWTCSLVVQ